MRIAFYGSSLLSSYWNGAATYYRGLLSELAQRGYAITFYEPAILDRQKHRDMEAPEWAKVVIYPPTAAAFQEVVGQAAAADIVVKASGVGVFDDALLEGLVARANPAALKIFWDVDAPATVAGLRADPSLLLRRLLPELDMVLTYGGGPPIVAAYGELGAKVCRPIYNALDPMTHRRSSPETRFSADLSFLGNRLPDREARVEEFFLRAARGLPGRSFVLGGEGWADKACPPNLRKLGHVGVADHNAFNSSPLAVLNIARDSMAEVGFSPATRVFEAAGAGACLITDCWQGLELFLTTDEEVLVARDGHDVIEHLSALTPARARMIGEAARRRIVAEHTYARRASEVDVLLRERIAAKRQRSLA